MSVSHVAEDSALRNEDDATGYRTETAWLRLMPHEGGVACDLRDCRRLGGSAPQVNPIPRNTARAIKLDAVYRMGVHFRPEVNQAPSPPPGVVEESRAA